MPIDGNIYILIAFASLVWSVLYDIYDISNVPVVPTALSQQGDSWLRQNEISHSIRKAVGFDTEDHLFMSVRIDP